MGVNIFEEENTKDSVAPLRYKRWLSGHLLGPLQTTTETTTSLSRLEEEHASFTLLFTFVYVLWIALTSSHW